ncbi:hypothetical protein [Mycolicibacterium tokaiense]|uniref:Uncharacterized protein n=1 Tax=Mycolicibacterium tokaiense TaxID=39695 RepID=A0A378TFB2_9MYCO|nr:hypothetical protein [Mycolicibacterium tokaiense]BBY86990.1 hypothetical protein MTOK_27720 [Mycolicibacterium tokaiense]STZ58493.1 Uncharacterised protein [Mycolicibacterium tokaiense]
MTRLRPSTISYLGYLMLLLAFVSLGALTAGLAFASEVVAATAATSLTLTAAGSVLSFRRGAAALARASEAAGATHKRSFWADQLEQDRVERYRARYRRPSLRTVEAPRRHTAPDAAPDRLSA